MGVSRIFFGYTWHARGVLFSPCKIDEPRYKILRTSQCNLHAPIFEGQADKIRRDGRAPQSANAEEIRRRSTCDIERQADKIRRDRRAPESANAEGIRRRSTCDIERQEPRSRVPTDKGEDWGCTTKGAGHGEPADDRVRLSEEWKRIGD